MFGKLLRFELSFHIRKKSFWLGLLAFGAIGLFFSTTQGRVDTEILINAPSVLVTQMGILSLSIVFVAAFLANAAFLRDGQYRVTQLVWSTPIPRSLLFWSRFLGVFLVASLVFLAAPVGMLVDVLLSVGGSRKTGPVEVFHYVWIYGVLALPTILFSTAVMTVTALFGRHQVAAYTVAIALYLGYFATAFLVGSPMMAGSNPASPDVIAWAAILDPFGLSAYFEQAKGWTIVERNSLLFDLDHIMIKNRVLWLLFALLAITVALLRFGPDLSTKRAPANKTDEIIEVRQVPYQPTRSVLGWPWAIHSTWAMIRMEISFLFRSWPFAAIFVLWCVAITPEMFAILQQSDYSNPHYPTTQALLDRFQFDMLPFFGTAFLIFLAGESVWREKSDRVNQLLGATPIKPLQLFVSRFVALSCLPLILISSAIFLVFSVQLSQGWSDFQPASYLALYLYGGVPLIAVALITLFCQVVASGRYSGMALSAILLAGAAGTLGTRIGLEHPLFRIATVPGLTSSGMTGFDQNNMVFFSYMLFWLSMGGLLSLVTIRYWPKGVTMGLDIFRSKGPQLSKARLISGFVAFGLVFSSGGWIIYQTNVVGGWQSFNEQLAGRADFEQRFGHFSDKAMPSLTAVSTKLDLYPTRHQAEIHGEYLLENRTSIAIEEILIVLGRKATIEDMNIENATIVDFDADTQAWVFKLDTPLQPEQEIQLTFDLRWKQTGFTDLSRSFQLVENGSLIMGPANLPFVGFPEALRMRDSMMRKKSGLKPLSDMPLLETALKGAKYPLPGNYDKVQFETVISTNSDETALAPGNLVRQWSEDGRNYFHYRSSKPITNVPVYVSARYKCLDDQYSTVQLEVCFTDERAANAPNILAAMKDTIEYADRNFGGYPGDVMRAIQVSSLAGINGFAAPNSLLLSENTAFEYDRTATSVLIDQIYRVVAHETAHQWWGHHLVPARSDKFQGSMVLVETLARYSELMMLEHKYGSVETRKWLNFELNRYFRGRGRDTQPEVSLYRVTNQDYLKYSKGAATMYAMKTALGEDAVNQALAGLITKYAVTSSPATSLDLLEELYLVSDQDLHPFIDSWFKEIVHTDLSLKLENMEKEADDKIQLDLSIMVSHKKLDGMGNSVEAMFDGPMTLHFLDEKGDVFHELTVDQAVSNKAISILLRRRPTSVILDPNYRYLDPDRENNTVDIDATGA